MRQICLALIVVILSFEGYSQNIRNVNWGMSESQVINIEKLDLYKRVEANSNNVVLMYKDFLLGNTFFVWYQFLYDSLSLITYKMSFSHSIEHPYDYMIKYLELLKEKYKEPIEVNWDCPDPKSRVYLEKSSDKNQEMGLLFYNGDIKRILYAWLAEETRIYLLVEGEAVPFKGSEIMLPLLSIIYMSYDFERLLEKSNKENLNNKL